MNKSKLVTGDLCVVRGRLHETDATIRILLGTENGDIAFGDTWFPLKDYSDFKLFEDDTGWTYITEVWRPKSNMTFRENKPSHITHTLIWKRKTEVEKQLDTVLANIAELQEQADKLKQLI